MKGVFGVEFVGPALGTFSSSHGYRPFIDFDNAGIPHVESQQVRACGVLQTSVGLRFELGTLKSLNDSGPRYMSGFIRPMFIHTRFLACVWTAIV